MTLLVRSINLGSLTFQLAHHMVHFMMMKKMVKLETTDLHKVNAAEKRATEAEGIEKKI